MVLEIKYIHKRDYTYKSNKGLSEKIVRNYYKKLGFEVWKGSYLQFLGSEKTFFLYQKEKYNRLVEEIKKMIGAKKFWQFFLFVKANAGIPDFIVKRNNDFFFVEVKLNNEQIKKNQIKTIVFLESLGLKTIIVRVSDNKRIFKKELDLETGKSRLVSYIPKLKLKW